MFKRVGLLEFEDTIEKKEVEIILSVIEGEGYDMCLDDSYNRPQYTIMKEDKA